MTGTPPLSGIVYFLDRDLAVMYGCGFARYASHTRPSVRQEARARARAITLSPFHPLSLSLSFYRDGTFRGAGKYRRIMTKKERSRETRVIEWEYGIRPQRRYLLATSD